MSYVVSQEDVDGFYRDGFVILRKVIPASLVSDLRRECDKAVAVERGKGQVQAQRFQPISKYAEVLDTRAFEDYAKLPALHDAFKRILGPEVFYGLLDVAGVFIEPSVKPWTVPWHRDITRQSSRFATDEEFAAFALDWDSLNQINCALYDDSFTWYVPGSHLRVTDHPAETAAITLPPGIDDADNAVLERRLLEYVQSVPGAVQVQLHAGDLLLYRAVGWHCGNYVPYRKRATILDVLYSPAYFEWRHAWLKGGAPKWKGVAAERNPAGE
jgi:hypothetical protein